MLPAYPRGTMLVSTEPTYLRGSHLYLARNGSKLTCDRAEGTYLLYIGPPRENMNELMTLGWYDHLVLLEGKQITIEAQCLHRSFMPVDIGERRERDYESTPTEGQ
jgi:hypothetical protein